MNESDNLPGMQRLAIVTTHPIQYNAPLFCELAKYVRLKVFYTCGQAQATVYDPGFDQQRQWDIPLLEGYEYEFVENVAKSPGSHHFRGINNPLLIEKILGFEPAALLVFGWSFISHLRVLQALHGKIPIIFRGDSNLLDEAAGFSFKKMARRLFLQWVYRKIDIALFVGKANKEYYRANRVPQEKLVFAPHCIDNNRFSPSAAVKAAALSRLQTLGIPSNSMVFLFAGKLEPKKDPLLLLRAFQKIEASAYHLVIVGNGILEAELKQAAAEDSRVHFLPFQNQSVMPSIYQMADIVVLPSKGPGETWGLAINEAMASGKAVIASDKCGASRDLIKEGLNGYVFESGNEVQLYERLLLAGKKSKCEMMGQHSLEIIGNWSYEAVVKVVLNLLKKR